MIGKLPETLIVGAEEYAIRSDYRNILQIFEAFNDPELEMVEKWIVAVYIMFEDFSCPDDVLDAVEQGFDFGEAQKQIEWFISAGHPEKKVLEMPVFDWEQDEQMIFSAINKVAGKETREMEYLHWWTFLGYFREIGEGSFSFIAGIRHKLNKGKKLDKNEQEFVRENRELVRLERRKTKEELAEEEERRAILGEVLG